MKRFAASSSKRLVSRVVLPAAMTAFTLSASAALAEENALILIDQSGSMLAESTPGVAKWQVARTLAKQFLDEVHPNREYALWTFNGTNYLPVVTFAMGASKDVVKTFVDALPPPGGSTPLAMAVCDAVDELIGYESSKFPPPEKRIVLESDGMENSTPNTDQCWGPNSLTAPPADFTVNSWQWKILNKARTGDANVPVDPGAEYRVIVNVDALFEYIPTAMSFAAGPSAAASSASPRAAASPNLGSATINATALVRPPKVPTIELMPAIAAGSTIPITAPLVKNHPGLPFYTKLTSSTTGRYREIDADHPLPQLGDVNGDACVDSADNQVLSASWGQMVPRGTKADINQDRKVDIYDYLTMVQNMGEGCKRK